MSTNLWLGERVEVFSFSLSYESIRGMLLDTDLYLFSEQGEFIDCKPIWKGKAVLALTEEDLRGARILVGLPIADFLPGPITMALVRRAYHGFEVEFTFVPGNPSIVLSAVPETVWRRWQRWGACTRGRVESSPSADFLIW